MNKTIHTEEVITKEYELAALVTNEAVEAELDNLLKDIPGGGSVEVCEKQPARAVVLAYPIKKHSSATLLVYILKADPSVIENVKKALGFKEGVLRSMIVTPPIKKIDLVKEVKNEVKKNSKARVSSLEKEVSVSQDDEMKRRLNPEISSTEELAKTLEKLAE